MKTFQEELDSFKKEIKEHTKGLDKSNLDLVDMQIKAYNERKLDSKVGNCKYCNNSGMIAYKNEYGVFALKTCVCYETRKCRERLKALGLLDFVYSLKGKFENLPENEEWEREAKKKIKDFIENNEAKHWLCLCGSPGSGKTTKSVIVLSELMKQYPNMTFDYFTWDTRYKELVFGKDETKQALLEQLQEVDILFIDDFFRHQDGVLPQIEKEVAKAVIDYRYINKKITLITSELYLTEIAHLDEAIGTRIYERCGYGKYLIQIKRDRSRNYRTKQNFGSII